MKALRIAVTVDPYIPVPPVLYGGIERVVDFVVRGLVERGHQVTLFAHPHSRTLANLVPYGVPPHFGWHPRLTELRQVGGELWRRRRQLDVILSFGRLAALLPVLPQRRLAKVQCYQRNLVPWRSVKKGAAMAGHSLRFAACSSSVYRESAVTGGSGGRWHTIFNGVDIARYTFNSSVGYDAPLAFLGRIEPCKGAHNAIAIAKSAGRRLLIAGNIPSQACEYFNREIAPHVDGNEISYIGPVDDEQKNLMLGSVAALLMPIEFDEPFGIVMAEAFACGTPVIAFARGSVFEVVRHRVNGFICHSLEAAVGAVGRLQEIDRSVVRADCEARFSSTVITDAYENLCWDLTQQCSAS